MPTWSRRSWKSLATNRSPDMSIIFAVSGVVIKELYRRKDFYVLFILTALMTLLLGSVNFFNDSSVFRYVKEICLLLIWISSLVISITTAGRQIPAEKENRTIFPLLAKPVSRAQMIVGKFLGCWFASGLMLLVFYGFFVLISGSREHQWPMSIYAQAFWLHWACLAVIIAMALLGSIVFTAFSSNVTICFCIVIGIFVVGGHLNTAALEMGEPGASILYALYYVIPHLEWYDVRPLVIHNQGVIRWIDVAGATLYAAVYTSTLLGATWVIFRRKSLA